MRKVKIINGTYGYRPQGSNRVKPVGIGGTVDLPEDEAARLVNLKVAEYMACELVDEAPKDPELPDGVVGIPEYNVGMTSKKLREIGELCGLTFKSNMTKDEMVAALDAHIAENMVDDPDSADSEMDGISEEETEEDAPVFDAAEAVQG